MRSILLVVIALRFLISDLSAQGWSVPEDKKGRLSTFPFDENTRKGGEKLYLVNCISCHGTPGKGNFLNLFPPPGDPATEKIQKNNDGEIYYKVSTGRGQMPSFKSVLSTNDVWNIISFIRSFNKEYKQQIMPVITSSAYPGAVVRIDLSFNTTDTTIVLLASAIKDNNSVPVVGAEVKLLVHRIFGMLQVDENKTTGNDGVAKFKIARTIPGDTAGNILVSARFINEEIFGSASKDTVLSAGKITIPVSLVAQRAMWNNIKKAPVWIILSYTLGLLAAWGFIIFVLMKLRDIYVVGDNLLSANMEKES